MKEAPEIIEKVEDKFTREFKELHTRMDEDFPIWDMDTSPSTSYKLEIEAKTKAHPSELEVVSNDLRTFCDNVQSTLAFADMQIMVRMAEAEGEDKREEIGKLERLLYFALEQGDERLMRLLLPPLRLSLIWFSLVRGWSAGRFLVYKKNKNVIFNFMAFDPRWLVYEVGDEGLIWVAHKTFKSKGALESQYKKEILGGKPWYKPWGKSQDSVEVIEYWVKEEDEIKNAIICDKKFLKVLQPVRTVIG